VLSFGGVEEHLEIFIEKIKKKVIEESIFGSQMRHHRCFILILAGLLSQKFIYKRFFYSDNWKNNNN